MLSNLNLSTTFSQDYYVRLRESELFSLNLQHSCSEVTGQIGTSIHGATEWVGCYRENQISLNWAFSVLAQDFSNALGVFPPTSNIMLIDCLGYDLGPFKTNEKCWLKIATLNWEKYLLL
jgi:hypothetical protein